MENSEEILFEVLFRITENMEEEEALQFVEKIFKPYRYGGYSDKSIFDYFNSEKNFWESKRMISEFIDKYLSPHKIDEYDVIISVDFKATTILRSMKDKFKNLKKQIMKSSYYRDEDQEYKGRKVCIIDDAIKTGSHVKPIIEHVLKEGAKEVHVFALAGVDDRIEKMELNYGERVKFFWEMHLSREQFGEQYGPKICSYMNSTYIPSDKDHFYYECKMKSPSEVFDFLRVADQLGHPYFVVQTGMENQDKLKISIHEKLDIHKKLLPPIFGTRKIMLYKMRLFVHADEGTVYLVPIVMDLDLGDRNGCSRDGLFCFERNVRHEYLPKCIREFCLEEKVAPEYILRLLRQNEESRADAQAEYKKFKEKYEKWKKEKYLKWKKEPGRECDTFENEYRNWKDIVCLKCFHFHCKRVFFNYFLKELNRVLVENNLEIRIADTGWDEIEKNYKIDREWEHLVEESIRGLEAESKGEPIAVSIDESFHKRDHKHVFHFKGSSEDISL